MNENVSVGNVKEIVLTIRMMLLLITHRSSSVYRSGFQSNVQCQTPELEVDNVGCWVQRDIKRSSLLVVSQYLK